MTIALDDFQRLKRQAEQDERDAARAEGALQAALARLKEEFGCRTIARAKALLKELEAQERTRYDRYLRLKRAYEKRRSVGSAGG